MARERDDDEEADEGPRISRAQDDPQNPLLLDRQALHAERLQFLHPITHDAMEFRASLPDDLNQVLTALRAARDLRSPSPLDQGPTTPAAGPTDRG